MNIHTPVSVLPGRAFGRLKRGIRSSGRLSDGYYSGRGGHKRAVTVTRVSEFVDFFLRLGGLGNFESTVSAANAGHWHY